MSYSRYALLPICCSLLVISACATKPDKEAYEMTNYHQALDNTDPQKTGLLQPGSEEEREAIERFTSFYRVFSPETVRKNVRNIYADDAYFRDGYREVEGLDNIEAYFLKSAGTVQECTFDIQDMATRKGNYYFRWVMHLTTKRWEDDLIATVGMSHVRFGKDGRISFHQDYWDTSIIYEKVPVMGSIIRWIKKQF
ncbi:MAG: nuclear transport factor 2 family protein [Syntrophobacterales bacterium]|nr:MAG: nuclear transport factor 2 family protein [Syntrophobacterales bacterium]